MRYAPEHKARTRRRILDSAGRRFRAGGFKATGVDEVMAGAGLTAGGFYAHFPSKQALLDEVMRSALEESRTRLQAGLEPVQGVAWLREVVRRYLSRAHRDAPEAGCALPSLSAEVARQGAPARRSFERHLMETIAALAPRAPAGPGGMSGEDRLLATLALGAGGLMLSRAVADPALSDRILMACRLLAVPEPAARKGPARPRETADVEPRREEANEGVRHRRAPRAGARSRAAPPGPGRRRRRT